MGIDPGLKGGIAFYQGSSLTVYATPVVTETFVKKGKKATRNLMDLHALRDMILDEKPDRGALEKVAARSGQGVTSMFRFGMNFGEHRAMMAALRIEWVEIPPQTWKADYDLSADKYASLETARVLFPANAAIDFRLKKHDGLAEAALIAKYAFDSDKYFN